MRPLVAAFWLAAMPGLCAAQGWDGARVTFQLGAFAGDRTETPFRSNADAVLRFSRSGLQIGATYAADDLADLHLIGFRDIGPHWRIGAELQRSNDPVFAGADLIWGLRIRYSDAGGTVDTRGGLVQSGPDGAFFVTVAMNQHLSARIAVRGLLHRYSTNPEAGDFFAVGLGADVALADTWSVYGDGIWSLSDDDLTETTAATVGLRRAIGPGRTVFAGLSGYSVNDTPSLGMTAGFTVTLDRPDSAAMFETDPWQMQLAQIGH